MKNMKKLFTVLVLCLFLLSSVALVFADNGNAGRATGNGADEGVANNGDNDEGEDSAGVSDDTTATTLADLAQKREKAKEQTKERKQEDASSNGLIAAKRLQEKARVLSQAKLEKAGQDFVQARNRFAVAKANYAEARNQFQLAKQNIIKCKDTESEECVQLRERINERAKIQAVKTADIITMHLEKVKAKVEGSPDISEEDASEILANLDSMTEEIESAKEAVESAESKEEIIDAARELKQKWVRTRKQVNLHTTSLVNARIAGVLVKSDQLNTKLDRILERMESDGLDTSSSAPLVDEFNALIEEAKIHYEVSVEKFNQAKSTEPVDTNLIREAQSHMKEAHKSLKNAQLKLRDIVVSVKQAGGSVDDVDDEDEGESNEDEQDDEDNQDDEDDEDEGSD